MPVRIYDISKKLGLENKDIISKAKALGITAAKVASSSLDKISAEYLENELLKDHPDIAARLNAPPVEAPKAPMVEEKIVVITAPPPPPPPAPAPVELAAPAPVAPAQSPNGVEPEPVEAPQEDVAEPVVAAIVEASAPPTPAPVIPPKPVVPPSPPKPQVGEKVGFIQLPQKPAPKPVEKPVQKFPQQGRPQQDQRRTDFGKRGDIRGFRGPTQPASPSMPGARGPQKGPAPRESGPKFSLPADAKVITIKPPIVVRDLAEQMKQKPFVVIGDLMKLGVFATVNQAIDEATAQKVCALHGFRFEVEKRERGGGVVHAPIKKVELDMEDKVEDLKPRAPVVTIMGHVDHGKTTLLDVIRKSDVAAGEAGGITQHIGAYTISFPHPERKKEIAQVTFLDTPGHAAFSSMRARGANVTDIVVLVVAANDGVMPQTLEALSHAKAAKVPILVAVNKIDHPNANPLKVRQQLQDKGLVPDDWGGDTIYVDVSALTKQGVDKLIEMILLQADLLELKANPNRRAKGNVIESGLEPGGPTATVLVRKGTLRVSDVILCGQFYGRVRALINEENKRLKEAGPSVAVKVLGLNGVPEAGLEFSVVEDEKAARDLAEQRMMEAKAEGLEAMRGKVTLENLFATLQSQQGKTLKIVVKADTQGSVEAIVEALKKIESDKVTLEIIHSAVGTITESDVALASASSAVILGFHTRVDSGVADKAKHEGVQIKLYAIIYELIDEVKEAMAGLLDPILKEIIIGSAEVRKVFELSKGAPVAGCIVSSGRIAKGKVRIRRRKEIIYEGLTQSLRRFQDEVNEVRAGMECGIRIDGFSEFQVGDAIECYSVEKIAQKL
ncbi:MAG TPA: translation initiation factor IF-2 [Verrucomicrobiae bacterium]|jgi:translation initiation factor IF-2|nr:translation initiation factor IF-2 [Verrucomicrobiae bacterium]